MTFSRAIALIDVAPCLLRNEVENYTGANDAAKINNALVSGASEVYLQRDKTYDCSAAVISLPSGVRLIGKNSTLNNLRLECIGTTGSEVSLTANVNQGDSALQFNTTGFSVGDWIYVMSCINCKSPEASPMQLGPLIAGEYVYYNEFRYIKSIDSGSQATVQGYMLFPYTTTPGTNSGSRTVSTVRKVTFADRSGLIGCNITGDYTGSGATTAFGKIYGKWTKDFLLHDCHLDIGTIAKYACEFSNSLYGSWEHSSVKRMSYGTEISSLPSGRSLYNSFIFFGCFEPSVTDNVIDGGYQCVDFTWDEANAGCVNPTADRNTMRNCRDGATTHPGTFGGSLSNNKTHSSMGIRVRSKSTVANGNQCVGDSLGSGNGIYFAGGFTEGSVAIGNTVSKFLNGISVEGSDIDGGPTDPIGCLISGNTVTNCAVGILISRNEASALNMGVLISANTITRCTSDGIQVLAYANGTTLDGNKILNMGASARAAIEFAANITGLTIRGHEFVNLGSSCFQIRGSSSTTFITDTTTFSAGEAAAFLVIDGNRSIGTDAGNTGIVRNLTDFDASLRAHGVWVNEGKLIARQMTGVTATNVLEAEGSTGTPLFGVNETGNIFETQGAPAAKTTSTTLTAAELLKRIVTVQQGAGAASAQQLPTGAAIQAAWPSNLGIGNSFDVAVINLSTVAAEAVSITTNTGITLVGSMDFPAYSATGNNSFGMLRLTRTGTNAFTVYRIA